MGGQQNRGHDCLRDPPNSGRGETVKVASRTLSVEDATLYILDAYAQHALRVQESPAAGDGSPGNGGAAGGSTRRTPVDGEAAGGALPTCWTDQLAQWESEGVEERERHERMAETVPRCLRGLPVFVMRNGGHYLATTHLKYVLGLEKKPYELFRILREVNRTSWQPHEEGGDGVDINEFHEKLGAKFLTAGVGVDHERDAGETLEEASEKRERASAESAVSRGVDALEATWRAYDQLAAVSDGVSADRFRACAVRFLGEQLSAPVGGEPPEEHFKEMDRRLAAAKFQRSVGPAGVAWGGKKPSKPRNPRGEECERKRVVPERVAPARPTLEEVEATLWDGVDESKLDAVEGEHVDKPDPKEEGDVCTPGVEWEQWYLDREGFVPNAPVPIRRLGEISRFWYEFGVPDQVVVMQHNYDNRLERRYEGRHNLWTFKVLSNIMPMSRFLKSAPSAETFVAADLAREALSDLGAQSKLGRSVAIAALAHSAGVPVEKDILHGSALDLLKLARVRVRASRKAKEATGGGEVEGGAKGEGAPPTLDEVFGHSVVTIGRSAAASVTESAVQVEKERWKSGSSDWGRGASE
ncbi:hypothetical protein KFL_010410020 [Klebsormidium nitens]|uniref:Uncharacterized protein n=1 Tax=Klebsormidium nitens TaxID=105231 RepID=A0A1Y1ISM8_KLENI|nr:hypothetical protein KFL_010410020 [Klebsormidium nitens]|eukprot:GAQ92529.1 hypothetical protein KFL_010410020 [Klebsormidium nitens]